jgi:enoyl-CoA hydratase/carnithine racemase
MCYFILSNLHPKQGVVMKSASVLFAALCGVGLVMGGCATKRYGRQIEVSEYERTALTCREIDMEIAKAQSFKDQVEATKFDGRDVLAILGDFGIGNLTERDEALKGADKRLQQLRDLRLTRGCPNGVTVAPTAEVAGAGGRAGD